MVYQRVWWVEEEVVVEEEDRMGCLKGKREEVVVGVKGKRCVKKRGVN